VLQKHPHAPHQRHQYRTSGSVSNLPRPVPQQRQNELLALLSPNAVAAGPASAGVNGNVGVFYGQQQQQPIQQQHQMMPPYHPTPPLSAPPFPMTIGPLPGSIPLPHYQNMATNGQMVFPSNDGQLSPMRNVPAQHQYPIPGPHHMVPIPPAPAMNGILPAPIPSQPLPPMQIHQGFPVHARPVPPPVLMPPAVPTSVGPGGGAGLLTNMGPVSPTTSTLGGGPKRTSAEVSAKLLGIFNAGVVNQTKAAL